MTLRPKTQNKRSLRQYNNAHEKKAADIRRSLTRRANMRRKYFKMLEREGEKVPSRSDRNENTSENEEENGDDTKEKDEDNSSGEESDEDGGFFEAKKSDNTPKIQKTEKNREDNKKKVLSHTEKLKLIKERKRQKREQMEEAVRQKVQDRDRKGKVRQKHKEMMNQFTRKGQPKMGPRITRLLDQIKDM